MFFFFGCLQSDTFFSSSLQKKNKTIFFFSISSNLKIVYLKISFYISSVFNLFKAFMNVKTGCFFVNDRQMQQQQQVIEMHNHLLSAHCAVHSHYLFVLRDAKSLNSAQTNFAAEKKKKWERNFICAFKTEITNNCNCIHCVARTHFHYIICI